MIALLLLLAGEGRYVVPKPGEPLGSPPPRLVPMSDARPEGLKVDVAFRGKRQRYGRLEYGTGRHAAVTLVADEVAPGKADLYVDTQRKGMITRGCLVKEGRAEVDAIVPKGDGVEKHRRTLQLRWGKVTRSVLAATCGYIESEVLLDGKKVRARRVDGDANGLFNDPRDRLILGDEEVPFAAIVSLGERRLIVRGDAVGRTLSLSPLTGTGKVKLATKVKASEVVVTLQSRDGIVASFRQSDGPASLPPGEYRLTSVQLTVPAPDGGLPWGYVFRDIGGGKPRWLKLARDGTLALDPIGKMSFAIEVTRAGDMATVLTRLLTGDGLLIEKAYRGTFDGQGCPAYVTLSAGERLLERVSTGFA